jgi:hypothetical protein
VRRACSGWDLVVEDAPSVFDVLFSPAGSQLLPHPDQQNQIRNRPSLGTPGSTILDVRSKEEFARNATSRRSTSLHPPRCVASSHWGKAALSSCGCLPLAAPIFSEVILMSSSSGRLLRLAWNKILPTSLPVPAQCGLVKGRKVT